MTPAERIPFAMHLQALLAVCGHNVSNDDIDMVIDMALCPKGERVVLDRTGDTDRLADLGEVLTKIRAAMQKSAAYAEGDSDDYSVAGAVAHGEASALRWVLDLFEDGPEGAPA